MSFILDALARAQASRSRKTAALALPASPSAAWVARQRRSLWRIVALALLGACAAGAALWAWRALRPAAPAVAAEQASTIAPDAIMAMGSLPKALPRPVPKFAPPTTLSQPLPQPLSQPVPPPSRSLGAVVPPPPSLTPSPPAEADDVRPLSELPSELQARIKRLKVGLYVYAPQRGRRFVVIDDHQMREGDELFPGVRLDEITEGGMVLQCNGLRVLVPAP